MPSLKPNPMPPPVPAIDKTILGAGIESFIFPFYKLGGAPRSVAGNGCRSFNVPTVPGPRCGQYRIVLPGRLVALEAGLP